MYLFGVCHDVGRDFTCIAYTHLELRGRKREYACCLSQTHNFASRSNNVEDTFLALGMKWGKKDDGKEIQRIGNL